MPCLAEGTFRPEYVFSVLFFGFTVFFTWDPWYISTGRTICEVTFIGIKYPNVRTALLGAPSRRRMVRQ